MKNIKDDTISAALEKVATRIEASPSDSRWEINLNAENRQIAENWIEAKVVFDKANKKMEASKTKINEIGLRSIAEKMFAEKRKVANPDVVIRKPDGKTDHEFKVILSDKFKISAKNCPAGSKKRDFFVDLFSDMVGFTREEAEFFVDSELDLRPVVSYRPINELLVGHYSKKREWINATQQEISAGNKLIGFLLWDGKTEPPEPFTDEEVGLIRVLNDDVVIKGDFLNRVVNYCKDVDQLIAIFKIVDPVIYPSHVEFCVSDSTATKLAREMSAARFVIEG